MDLQENLQQVEANICKACENAGRKRSDVTLIAVSKTKPVEMLQTVYDLGPRDFGENKVQEMCGFTKQQARGVIDKMRGEGLLKIHNHGKKSYYEKL